jgi:hypothetical protein
MAAYIGLRPCCSRSSAGLTSAASGWYPTASQCLRQQHARIQTALENIQIISLVVERRRYRRVAAETAATEVTRIILGVEF